MKVQRDMFLKVALAAVGISALALSSAAQARDVAWSVGFGSAGVQIGLSNAPQVIYRQPFYAPQTVYYSQPQVVYAQPYVSYAQPQVVYAPQPYYAQQPYYTQQPYYASQPYYGGAAYAPPTVVYRDWGPRHHGHHPRWSHDRRH